MKGFKFGTFIVLLFGLLAFSLPPADAKAVDRIHGDNRIETAIEISKYGWNSSGHVVLARADHPVDALASASLVAKTGAPILLTNSESLGDGILEELERLGTHTVYILGGEQAIQPEVENTLTAEGLAVTRVAGDNRYSTAEAVNEEAGYSGKSTAILVSGEVAADALSASGMAANQERPIYLTRPDSLSVNLPDSVNEVIIFGGPSAVSEAVESELKNDGKEVRRIQGDNRFATSVEAANAANLQGTHNIIVRGTSVNSSKEDYPDAVAAAGLANQLNAPVVLSHHDSPRSSTLDYVSESDKQPIILGGPAAVSDEAAQSFTDEGIYKGTSENTHSEFIDDVIATGEKYMGAEYEFGASPHRTDRFDCSSFTQRVFAENGVDIPRVSRNQINAGEEVSTNDLQKGDLVFFDTGGDGVINHVAIYIDEDKLFHATVTLGVDYTGFTPYWQDALVGATRVTQ
ncbi:cell wall-binding repeat-containing protein [Thalassorhabdus alkalitolerans]|uniref:Cell wall-binding repeat-containing protein n=1 Tax=Thalassorhabdus alkalitolerans TaxID=2282697 RepID=A0ABW0YJ70_9BACI